MIGLWCQIPGVYLITLEILNLPNLNICYILRQIKTNKNDFCLLCLINSQNYPSHGGEPVAVFRGGNESYWPHRPIVLFF